LRKKKAPWRSSRGAFAPFRRGARPARRSPGLGSRQAALGQGQGDREEDHRDQPDHELARKELGYVVYENKWTLESDLRKKAGLGAFGTSGSPRPRRTGAWMKKAGRSWRISWGLSGQRILTFKSSRFRKVLSRRDDGAREVFEKHLATRGKSFA